MITPGTCQNLSSGTASRSQVSKDLLDRAFQKTYGLKLKDLFHTLDHALGTYRFSVSTVVPTLTKTAWSIKSKEITNDRPAMSRKQFLYNIKRASFEKEWGTNYDHPGFRARTLAFVFRLTPRFGPLKALGFKVPTPRPRGCLKTVSTWP